MKSTSKILAFFLLILMAVTLFFSCNAKNDPEDPDNESITEGEEEMMNPEDNYEGTLKITPSED